jgi:hypothetical protein
VLMLRVRVSIVFVCFACFYLDAAFSCVSMLSVLTVFGLVCLFLFVHGCLGYLFVGNCLECVDAQCIDHFFGGSFLTFLFVGSCLECVDAQCIYRVCMFSFFFL